MQPQNQAAGQTCPVPRWQQLLVESHLDIDVILGDLPGTTTDSKGQATNSQAIEQGVVFLTEPGQVVELRVLGIHGKKRTDSGYFDQPGKLANAAAAYDGKAEGLYFTLNPVNRALIARANNRVKDYAEHTTSDSDIVRRINLPIDFDPVRPAGISSSDAEKQAALQRAWICRAWLSAQGWPEPVYADSGNGAHLLYAIDLANSDESAELVKTTLLALSTLFSDATVKIDASTSNASRIFKLYGTLACKGDSTPDRPHRRATIMASPKQRQVVQREQLEALAARAPRSDKRSMGQGSSSDSIDNTDRAKAYGKAALDQEIASLGTTTDGNRNNQLFQSAAALFSLVAGGVLDRAEVWQALMDTAKVLGLPENEARRTIESGEKHGLAQPRSVPKTQNPQKGRTSPQLALVRERSTVGQAVNPPSAPPTSSKPNQSADIATRLLMHVDELDNLPPIRWLIKDLLPANSLVELHGASSTGKTQVIFDIAQTLAATGLTVIYVAAEGLQGYRGRKKAWQKFRKQNGGSLYLWREPVHLFERPAVRMFLDAVKPKQPAVIVFDTLSRCSLGADENNQKDMGFILEALDLVRRETGAAVVAVHHTNATGARERGSTVIRGGMDVMIEVSKDDDLISVSCSKMKDAGEFDSIYLKPVLVDIGEENPVPVLIPAEKRIQTQADKLTTLQMEILRAVGMEMFGVSGIKSNQLDELLPPTTKRASKYHSLNTLIRLGYVEPHVKGDPYRITEAGRLKLSNAENSSLASKSKLSKASLSPFIWTLPDPSPMSSPIPHTTGCGLDETSDNASRTETANTGAIKPVPNDTQSLSNVQERSIGQDDLAPTEPRTVNQAQAAVPGEPSEPVQPETRPTSVPMSQTELARYAAQVNVPYPTTSGDELYRIAEIIPRWRRNAFEERLEDAVGAYYEEVARRGQEPIEKPIPDLLALYVLPGLVTADELHEGYQQARAVGHGQAFVTALQARNAKAVEVLKTWLEGHQVRETVLIDRMPSSAL